jgi:hypothetical protein
VSYDAEYFYLKGSARAKRRSNPITKKILVITTDAVFLVITCKR